MAPLSDQRADKRRSAEQHRRVDTETGGVELEMAESPPSPPTFEGDFDELVSVVGEFGRFQLRLFLLLQPPFVFLALTYFSQIWLVLEPDHWCRVPALEARGWSAAAVRNISAPLERRDGAVAHAQCSMYAVDFATVDPASWSPGNDTPVVACQHGWLYDFSRIYPTIVSDNDWVCDSAWKPTLASTMFFAGSMLGTIIFGWVSDRFGRLPSLVLANLTSCLAGFASAFSTSLPMFVVLRFVYGMGNNLQCMQAIVLLTEFVGVKYRAMVVNLPLAVSFCGAIVALPWLAKAVYHWQYMAMATSLPMAFVLLYYVLDVPESCRWLQETGRIERAVQVMKRIAVENGRQVPDQVWEAFTAAAQRRHDWQRTKRWPTLLDAMRLPRLRRRLLTLTVGAMLVMLQYDLIARATKYDVDVYTAQSVLGVTEAPADLLTWLLIDTVGRRWTMTGALVSTSGMAAALAALLSRGEMAVASTAVAFFCRCGATVALNVLWQLEMELVPTVVRGRVVAASHVAGHFCTMLSPMILQLERLDRGLPPLVLVAVTLLGGVVFSTVPETMARPLPDTLDEGEKFGVEQRFWQFFWRSPCAVNNVNKRGLEGCDNPTVDVESEAA